MNGVFSRGDLRLLLGAQPGGRSVRRFITEGNVHTNNLGLFIQDAWTIGSKLAVNLGLRTEREHIPTYALAADYPDDVIPKYGIDFKFGDKVAPRPGFAYDLKGDGKWKVFGSWGIFYDIFKLELPRGSFGGDHWIELLLDARHLRLAKSVGVVGLPAGVPRYFPPPSHRLPAPIFGSDSVPAGPQTDEARKRPPSASITATPIMAVSAHYVHKQLDRDD